MSLTGKIEVVPLSCNKNRNGKITKGELTLFGVRYKFRIIAKNSKNHEERIHYENGYRYRIRLPNRNLQDVYSDVCTKMYTVDMAQTKLVIRNHYKIVWHEKYERGICRQL